MDITKIVYMILRGILYIAVIAAAMLFILLAVSGCSRSERKPLVYEGRMQFAGISGSSLEVWIDTQTGICYLTSPDGIEVMVDHEGKPFIANGWRDYGAED